jgi:tRNA-dihydrouridine synthase
MIGVNVTSLRNGVVLAELGGYGDGPYCAVHGAGAALVMLGTYIVDPNPNVPYPASFVFRPGRLQYGAYLREHVAAARASGGLVSVSVISVRVEDSVDFVQAAAEAGADCVSICLHSTMEMFVTAGVSSALCRKEHWPELRRWTTTVLSAVNIPVVFKLGWSDTPNTLGAVDLLADAGASIVHVNVTRTRAESDGLATVERLRGHCPILIAGGGIRDEAGARRTLAAGADAVAIGTAAMKDVGLCRRIQEAIRGIER